MIPRVAVVIPAYNAAQHLSSSLESVAALKYPHQALEVIVVDDGSTDGTAELARTLLASLPVEAQVLTQSNRGPSAARNTGWRRSSAEWVQFLDADDELSEDKVLLQAADARLSNQQVCCAYSAWLEVETDQVQTLHDPDVDADPLLRLLLAENFVHLSSALMRRSWLERIDGFDERHRLIEDVDLQLRLAIGGGTFQKIEAPHPVAVYRRRAHSLSRSSRLEFSRGCVRNARLVHQHWQLSGAGISEEGRDALVSIYENALRVFCEHEGDDFDSAWRSIKAIQGSFQPSGAKLRSLSRLVGARNAYRVSTALRRLRGLTV
jgi:glycosyltransferase involved in cell wall biosynthesis